MGYPRNFRKKSEVNIDKHAQKFLQDLNTLVDVNKYSYLVNNKLKNDHFVGRNSSTFNKYINVIIRKQ